MLCLLYPPFILCPISKTKEDVAFRYLSEWDSPLLPTPGPEPNMVQDRQVIKGGATGETIK